MWVHLQVDMSARQFLQNVPSLPTQPLVQWILGFPQA
jgi:hypothetical protein